MCDWLISTSNLKCFLTVEVIILCKVRSHIGLIHCIVLSAKVKNLLSFIFMIECHFCFRFLHFWMLEAMRKSGKLHIGNPRDLTSSKCVHRFESIFRSLDGTNYFIGVWIIMILLLKLLLEDFMARVSLLGAFIFFS